jgi:hypothetical protein
MTTTPQIYTQEEIAKAQSLIREYEVGILDELYIQKEQHPDIYAGAHVFCEGARAGRIIAGRSVITPSELYEECGKQIPLSCGCYYGASSNYQPDRANQWIGDMRKATGLDWYKLTTIERYLYQCYRLEDKHRSGSYSALYPIPAENPALQLLIALIEQVLNKFNK